MNPHADSVQHPSDYEVFDAMPAHHQARTSHENIRDVRDALSRFGARPAAAEPVSDIVNDMIDALPATTQPAQQDTVEALMAMTEEEIDAELRTLGMEPEEALRRGTAAIEGALAAIRSTPPAEKQAAPSGEDNHG